MTTSEVTSAAAGHGPQGEAGIPSEPIVEGLATALQWYGDILEEKLASLSREQSVLLMKLEAARDVSDSKVSQGISFLVVFLRTATSP